MRIKIEGDTDMQMDFGEVVTENYQVILSCYKDNKLRTGNDLRITAMVLFPEPIPQGKEEEYILARTKGVKAVIVTDKQFWRKIYRYREGVFGGWGDNKKENYDFMFYWLLWEQRWADVSLTKFIGRLRAEGVNRERKLYNPNVLRSTETIKGEDNWEEITRELEGIKFTGFKPEVVELEIHDPNLRVVKFKNNDDMKAFLNSHLENPKATAYTPSWKYLAYTVAKDGVVNPVKCFKKKDGSILLNKGKHRYIVSRLLGHKTIPALIAYQR